MKAMLGGAVAPALSWQLVELDAVADLLGSLEVTGRGETGAGVVLAGRHPLAGDVVAVQTGDGWVVVSR